MVLGLRVRGLGDLGGLHVPRAFEVWGVLGALRVFVFGA